MKTPKTFEEGLQRLQDVLAQMQDEATSLDKAVKLYAEAAGLVEYCSRTLDKTSLQIGEISGRMAAANTAPGGQDAEQNVEEQA